MARILIADDDLKIQDIVSEILSAGGHQVSVCTNGAETLKEAAENPPDLILLDVCLPVIDGYSVALKILQDEKTKDVPVIMLVSSKAEKEKASELSVGKTLNKPFKPQDLISAVNEVLG